ncbi:hypothetical protein A0H81_00675 [Grifola frondosa]|uniref:Uncharacterized protein n=1 Tax=Grifola frondosa TaxID=5627 RepID=A0A1C7MWM1_GRIFR|nr:hypothetical protein A0H81_00675 [Grifola frondosa]
MELGDDCTPIVTHRELINTLMEEGTRPFAALESGRVEGSDSGSSATPRRHHSVHHQYPAQPLDRTGQPRVPRNTRQVLHYLAAAMQLSSPRQECDSRPLSPALSLSDLVTVRREMLNILINIAGLIFFPPTVPSRGVQRHVRRTFELLASFIADPVEAVPPFNCILLSGKPVQQPQPPAAADLALDVFMRLAHPDGNREAFSHAIPQPWLWTVAEALVHRLPVADHDFQVMTRDPWLAYVEKVMFALYSLAFLAPPALKRRLLADRALGFARVLVRIATKLLVHAPPEYRTMFSVLVRRAIETLRLVDDGEDAFDTSQAALPTLTFGMGYGEHGRAASRKARASLAGTRRSLCWAS